MSAITEYLKLIPRGLKNGEKILEGIVNNVQLKNGKLPQDQKDEIIRRRLICAGCPYMSTHAKTSVEYVNLTGQKYKTKRTEEHCSLCGCGITGKTASLASNCGVESWNQQNLANEPLKWTKYETEGK